jgi:hypothetical protein
MNDIERVKALRDAGHITAEEAERLIGVLSELDAPAEADAVDAAPGDAGSGAASSASTEAGASDPAPEPDAGAERASDIGATVGATVAAAMRGAAHEVAAEARQHAHEVRDEVRAATAGQGSATADPTPIDLAPGGTRWCTVDLHVAELSVVADDVPEPVIESEDEKALVVTPTDEGLRVASHLEKSIEGWFGRRRSFRIHVRLPRGWGVKLDLKAGEADVADVPYVRGRMLAGDLSVRGAKAVDLSKAAGDLSVAFRPTTGRHRIIAKAGDVDVRFLVGSDAAVEAGVAMGDLHAPGFDVEHRTVGARASGRLGEGRAQVVVRLSAGDLSLRSDAKEG